MDYVNFFISRTEMKILTKMLVEKRQQYYSLHEVQELIHLKKIDIWKAMTNIN
jgi:hypothetical protein